MRVYVYKSQFRRYSSGELFQCGRGSWRNEQASNFLYRTCACMKCFIQKKFQLNAWRCHLHYTTMFILLNYYAWHLCNPFACPTIQVHGIEIIFNLTRLQFYNFADLLLKIQNFDTFYDYPFKKLVMKIIDTLIEYNPKKISKHVLYTFH